MIVCIYYLSFPGFRVNSLGIERCPLQNERRRPLRRQKSAAFDLNRISNIVKVIFAASSVWLDTSDSDPPLPMSSGLIGSIVTTICCRYVCSGSNFGLFQALGRRRPLFTARPIGYNARSAQSAGPLKPADHSKGAD